MDKKKENKDKYFTLCLAQRIEAVKVSSLGTNVWLPNDDVRMYTHNPLIK